MKRKLLLCLSLLLLTGCAGGSIHDANAKKNSKRKRRNVLHILNWNGKFYDFQGREPIKQATFQTWSLTRMEHGSQSAHLRS